MLQTHPHGIRHGRFAGVRRTDSFRIRLAAAPQCFMRPIADGCGNRLFPAVAGETVDNVFVKRFADALPASLRGNEVTIRIAKGFRPFYNV
jgi:hypothetical protein